MIHLQTPFRLAALFWLIAFSAVAQAPPQPQLLPEKSQDRVDYYVQNPGYGDMTLTFAFKLNNAQCTLTAPYTVVVPAQQKIKPFVLTPVDKKKDWSYTVSYSWIPGNATAIPDAKYAYRPPYKSGKAFPVGQGFNGKFSHTFESAYAVDWNMPEGTEVCAAREGIVVATKNEYSTGGTNKAFFGSKANYIQIQHSDHTIGEYDHLKKDGVLVRPGQRVKAGDVIGRSGNTGYSSGPHLHFMVSRAVNGKQRQSVPFRLDAKEGTSLVPSQGTSYTAP